MLQLSDIQFLYELAKQAPLQRALDAHAVSAVFQRIDEELSIAAGQAAMEAAMKRKPQPQPAPEAAEPAKPAVAAAVAKAVKSNTGAE